MTPLRPVHQVLGTYAKMLRGDEERKGGQVTLPWTSKHEIQVVYHLLGQTG